MHPPPLPPDDLARQEASNEEPGTIGGMRLSWDQGTEDGIFEGKESAVIGSVAPDRRRTDRRRLPEPGMEAPKAFPSPDQEAARAERVLVRALLKGLGLDRWPDEHKVDAETMRRVGELLRVAVQGTIDLLRARALIKSEVQAQMTMIVTRDNNPLKLSPNAEAALVHLLGPAQRGFMSANAAMEDAYRDLVAHQFGFTAGTRAALAEVLNRFDPAKLEERLASKSMLDSLLPAHRKAKLWDLFTERYTQISAEAEDNFQRMLGKEFVQAYEAQVAKLTTPERKPEK
jgi:FHA domain-containing protein